jgi:hypothetical protein
VLCERGGESGRIVKGEVVALAGGAAMILINQEADGFSTLADDHVLPATHVTCQLLCGVENQSLHQLKLSTNGNNLV